MFVFLIFLTLNGLAAGCTAPTIANANTTLASNGTYSVQCHQGYTLSGVTTLTCVDGNIKEELPSCVKGSSSCSSPTIMNGEAALNDGKWNVECNAGFKLNGTAVLECNSKTSQFVTLPACLEEVTAKNCSVPTVAKSVILPNVPITNAMYKVGCVSGYKLIGSNYLTCAGGVIKEKLPTCVPDPFNCDAGTYFKRGKCVLCPENTYSEVKAVGCTRCGEGEESEAGSKSASDCQIVVKVPPQVKPEARPEDRLEGNTVGNGLGAGKGESELPPHVDETEDRTLVQSKYRGTFSDFDNSVEEGKAVKDQEEPKKRFDMVLIIMIVVIIVIIIAIVGLVVKFIVLRPKPVYTPVTEGEEVEMTVEDIDV